MFTDTAVALTGFVDDAAYQFVIIYKSVESS